MKITKKQYEKALEDVEKYQKAEEICNWWENAMGQLEGKIDGMDVDYIDFEVGSMQFSAKVVPKKEESRADEDAGSGEAA